MPVNQVQFTVSTKLFTGKRGSTFVVKSMSSVRDTNNGSASGVQIMCITKICISLNAKCGVDFSIGVNANSYLRNTEVGLSIMPATIVYLVFS